jgi:precorrin-2 dehydrogenase/sirohydrochlorin ferrochelatase
MRLYPVFLKLENTPCLVVGGGDVGERKVCALLEAGARVTVIAPEATALLQETALQGGLSWVKREYRDGDLCGFPLAIAATDSAAVNRLIHEEASTRGVLLNCVDDPEHSSFYVPAVARKGALTLAISTSGAAPYLARRLREYFEQKLYPGLEADLERVEVTRSAIVKEGNPAEEKRMRIEHELRPLVEDIIKKMADA